MTRLGLPAALAAGAAGWQHLGEPARLPGLAALAAAAALAWLLAVAAALIAATSVPLLAPRRLRVAWRRGQDRPHVPAWLRRAVYAADRHACAYCRTAGGGLALDHVFPYALGGAASLWNLVTLCADHNRVKSDYWRWPSGHVTYRAWANADNAVLAAAILAAERRARRNPARWLRVAWVL